MTVSLEMKPTVLSTHTKGEAGPSKLKAETTLTIRLQIKPRKRLGRCN